MLKGRCVCSTLSWWTLNAHAVLPLCFCCDQQHSFREKAGLPGTSPVSSAYRILRLCPANSQHCEGNIMSAFSTLGEL